MIESADSLIRWAARAPGARRWDRPGATVVACAGLAHWDRLVMNGEPDAVAVLLRAVLAETGESFRPFGTEELVTEVVARVPELEMSARFAWMETTRRTSRPMLGQWLAEADGAEITALITEAYPESYAWPGDPAVRRWAGVRGAGGELLTVAAEAWSTPEIGFLSGVATRPSARGRGLGAAICAFTTNELLDGRDRVALLVDYRNTAAMATYTGLGYAVRRVAAARRR
ncbi:GNAT family N-acetyltransferase [Actinoplanes sp. G11-F43]|uniref:GNAT family N-acetyltransferase n=1 Tax=Actinoplanes sp. G11-F43 TaxID=3424130 RepID=UPI003D32AA1E